MTHNEERELTAGTDLYNSLRFLHREVRSWCEHPFYAAGASDLQDSNRFGATNVTRIEDCVRTGD